MDTHPNDDLYAGIATARYARRDGELKAPAPPAVPERTLPLDRRPGASAFKPSKKLNTPAALGRELARLRKRMARYLADHAPAPASLRDVTPLTRFDWREETADDRRDFPGALAGRGTWQSVAIPHYGPPLGRAATLYRAPFHVTAEMLARGSLWVAFDGVDYKAQVFVNGALVGTHEGFFAPFECECTAQARLGENTLVVRVENDFICMGSVDGAEGCRLDGDKIYAASGPGYDDPVLGWHHCPPGMGIYQPVRVEARSRQFIRDVYVRPLPDGHRAGSSRRSAAKAEAWIEVVNGDLSDEVVAFDLSLFGQNFRRTVFRDRRVTPTTTDIRGHGDLDKDLKPVIPKLAGPGVSSYRLSVDLPDARRWDPDTPWLYQLQVALVDGAGVVRDRRAQSFGMRTFVQDEQSTPMGTFYLNGREIRLRGANTMGFEQQDVMRGDWDRLIDDILLAKLCHMNFLRLTQRPVQKEVYEYCDRLGLMTQTDLPLFGCLRRNQLCEAVRQAGEMERLVRPHPCNILVSFINEPFPNGQGRPHRNLTRDELESFFDMAGRVVRMANPERVIKNVDGDYDPPTAAGMPDNHCYCGWYIGHAIDLGEVNAGRWIPIKPGWHYGCGEFGAEGLDSLGVMRKYYPEGWLPPDGEPPAAPWRPEKLIGNQTNRFQYLWFPAQTTPGAWVEASQTHQAWVTRLMTGAFRRNNGMNSFAIHLFIDAWPCGWMKAIMDVDRVPKKAFFAYREALTPLMVSLRTDRRAYFGGEEVAMEAWVCNDTHDRPAGAQVRYQVEIGGRVVASGRARADVPVCAARPQGMIRFRLPDLSARREAVVRLALTDRAGEILFDTQQAIEIFPRPSAAPPRRAFIIGGKNGPAATLARELGLRCTRTAAPAGSDVILIDDPAALAGRRTAVEAAVKAGACAVLLELPPGTHRIAGDALTVVPGGMGSRHFAECGTGHPLVCGFEPHDFWFWHDASVGYPTPLLDTVLDPAPSGWSTILGSGNGSWATPWTAVPAAVEKRVGAGVVRVCQVKLAHRTPGNPAAAIFARRLIGDRA